MNPPTPICGFSPGAPTDSAHPKHSSPWPCSPEAASAHHYPDDPQRTATKPTHTNDSRPLHVLRNELLKRQTSVTTILLVDPSSPLDRHVVDEYLSLVDFVILDHRA